MKNFIVKTFGDNTRIAREYGYRSKYSGLSKLTDIEVKAETKEDATETIGKIAKVWYALNGEIE